MFLAHFTSTDLSIILEWPVSKILFWYNEAYPLFKKLNPEAKADE